MLKVTCKGCGANCEVPDDFAGSEIRCKTCSEVTPIVRRIKNGDIKCTQAPPKPTDGQTVMMTLATLILIFVIAVGLIAGACSR